MAAKQPTGLLAGAIVSFLGMVIAIAVAYSFHNDLRENTTKFEKSEADKRAADTTIRKLDEEIQAMKQLSGSTLEQVGVGDDQNPSTVLGDWKSQMTRYGGTLAQPTLIQTIVKLRQEFDNASKERDALSNDLKTAQATINALQTQYEGRVTEFSTAKTDIEGQLLSLQTQHEEQVATKNNEIEELKTDRDQIKIDLEREREEHQQDVERLRNENTQLISTNDLLREKLNEVTADNFEMPDGTIQWVDIANHIVWIDLGDADNLPPQTTFSVYSKSHRGVGRGKEDLIASIEVLRTTGPHMAQARVLEDDIYRPIKPGDVIYTPLWSPGRRPKFSLIGLTDLDGDGRSDRDNLREIIAATGAEIDNEVDDEGNRTGNGISINTKFLVVGELPDPSLTPSPKEQQIAERILNANVAMRKEARESGVRVVGLNDFLDYIGYKSQRRVWVPGEEVPWTLQNGAQSIGVDTVGGNNRLGTGQVSGAFSRSKRVKAESSTGQTSKRFGKGY